MSDFRRTIESVNHTQDALSNKKQWKIEFLHLPTNQRVWFHGYITSLSDSFNSDWADEDVFGRMDPISIFKSTKRAISLGWAIPANSEQEARENIAAINQFVQFLYPQYVQTVSLDKFQKNILSSFKNRPKLTEKQKADIFLNMSTNFTLNQRKSNHMVSPPLLKVRFANLIHASDKSQQSSVISGGLIVKVNGGVQIEPDLETGFFGTEPGLLYPKLWRISLNLTAFHTHSLGWKSVAFSDNLGGSGRFVSDNFPYGVTGVSRK